MTGPSGLTPISLNGSITPIAPAGGDGYQAGACNIGPWEIRRRRAFSVASFAVAAVLLVLLVVADAPQVARLLVFLPLWGGMFSWLQARRRFCAGYAVGRVSNFGDGVASTKAVTDAAAHREDLKAVARMTRDSFLLALIPAAIVVLLPL